MGRKYLALELLLSLFICILCHESKSAPSTSSEATDRTAASAERAKIRKFTFEYRFRVKGVKPTTGEVAKLVRMWLPCPPNDEFQKAEILAIHNPGETKLNRESRFGNRIWYFEARPTDEFMSMVAYDITRREVRRGPLDGDSHATDKLSDSDRSLYLAADKLVPITGKPLKLLDSVKLQKDKLARAQQLYNLVDEHVTYKKEGTGWGRGDSNWVCDSGYGNCTDFHSLFMSLARSQGIPTRFEIGFSVPADKPFGKIEGYHCWDWFYIDGRGWIPVDISEADKHPDMKEYYFGNLTADRVAFSTGRDIELVPKPAGGPLNFFVYPYIEVDGKPLPQENVELQFTFNDPAQ